MTFNFRSIPIGELCQGIYDGPHATPAPSDSGAIFLGISNFVNGKLNLSPSNIRYISEEDYPKWTKRVTPKAHDIVFSYEATLNLYAIIPDGFRGCLGRRMALMRPDEGVVDYRFLYYYMFSPAWREEVERYKVNGSTVDRIPLVSFPSFRVDLPNMRTQKAIADILFAIDQKIDSNSRVNDNLLEQIRTLCTAWLSDYKPFDGAVPSDWVETPLSDIAEFVSGYSYKGSELTDSTIAMATIKNFDRKGGFKLDGYKEIIPSSKLKESQHAELFDTLVAHTDLTQNAEVIGNAEPVMSKSGYDDIIFSMDLVKVLPKKENVSKFLLAAILQDKKFKAHCLGYVNGTTVLHLSKKALPEYKLFLPSDLSKLRPLDEIVTTLYKQISSNISENTYLEELRVALLPKLMSGELDVSGIDL